MKKIIRVFILISLALLLLSGCSATPSTAGDSPAVETERNILETGEIEADPELTEVENDPVCGTWEFCSASFGARIHIQDVDQSFLMIFTYAGDTADSVYDGT